jgi:hypothetical protein
VLWTETGGSYEIDGCEFGSVKAHLLGDVEHFAFAGIIYENLKVVRVFLNHDPQSIPFGFVSLPVVHSSVSLSYWFMSQRQHPHPRNNSLLLCEPSGEEQVSMVGFPFLQKPFTRTALRDSVEALLVPIPPTGLMNFSGDYGGSHPSAT